MQIAQSTLSSLFVCSPFRDHC